MREIRRWTADEDSLLKSVWPDEKKVAQETGRTINAIRVRAHRLRLRVFWPWDEGSKRRLRRHKKIDKAISTVLKMRSSRVVKIFYRGGSVSELSVSHLLMANA